VTLSGVTVNGFNCIAYDGEDKLLWNPELLNDDVGTFIHCAMPKTSLCTDELH